MTFDIALLLTQDGIATGAVYAMIALGVVLVFNVTRIVFVSFGDLIAYSALTLAELQTGAVPGTIWLVAALAGMALIFEGYALSRGRQMVRMPKSILYYGILPLIPVVA